MHSDETKKHFIELSAQGYNVPDLMQKLGIGRSTAFAWQREFQSRIHNLRIVRYQAAQDRLLGPYEERLKAALDRLRKYEQELDSRHLRYACVSELQALINDARKQVDKLCVLPVFADNTETTTEPADKTDATSASNGPDAPLNQ
jgi:hypothetical protein